METFTKEGIWSRDFALLFASALLFWCSFQFYMPTLPLFMVQRLDSSPAQVGLISGLMSLTAIFVRSFAGYSLDRFGRREIFVGALSVLTLAAFAYLLVSSVVSLTLVRLLYGIPFGIITASQMTVAGDLTLGSRRGEAMGIFILTSTLATAIAPGLAMAVLGNGHFPRLFIAAGLLAASSVLLASLIRYPVIRDAKAKLSLRSVFEPRVVPVALTTLFHGMTYGSIVSFIPLYAKQLPAANLGLFYLIFAAGQIASRVFAGRVHDRHGPKWVVLAGFTLLMAGFFILALGRAALSFLAAGLVYGLGWGLAHPSLQTMAIEQVPPPRRGAASATFFNGFDVGVFSGSYIMAFVAQARGGYAGMYLVDAFILGIPLFLFFVWTLPRYRVWKPEGGL